jgi:hypothetical protein
MLSSILHLSLAGEPIGSLIEGIDKLCSKIYRRRLGYQFYTKGINLNRPHSPPKFRSQRQRKEMQQETNSGIFI